jgi:hypothetical protein
MPIGKTFTISIQIPNNRVKSDNHEEFIHDISMARHSQFQYKSQTMESKATIMKSSYMTYPWQHTPIKSKMVKVYSTKREG